MNRKLKMGMIGGGAGAFIGGVHRIAAAMDGKIELVCGAFSSNPEQSKAFGASLFLPESRCYGTYAEMITHEKTLPEGERMDFVAIVTPNFLHFAPAKLALENGFHVVCDKPMTLTVSEAQELVDLVEKTGLLFALTHNYTGYPMIKQARDMVRQGAFGKVRKVVVEYPQGWLSTKLEATGQKQAAWRSDPAKSGKVGAMGDVGTHAENLAEYVTGLQIESLCADLTAFVEGRLLDDDGNILLRLEQGAKGIFHVSQIAAGEENALSLRVYGEKGGFAWSQMEPNTLKVQWLDQPTQLYRTGVGPLSPAAQAHARIPSGHPEGYLEAFANIYRNFALQLIARLEGTEVDTALYDFPTVRDGLRGMQFIEAVVASAASEQKWYPFS